MQRQAEEKAAAEEAAAAAEAERQKQLQEEYEESLPDDIKERVQAAVTKELVRLGCWGIGMQAAGQWLGLMTSNNNRQQQEDQWT